MRDVDTLKGLHGVKTMAGTKRRSIPHAQSSAYLDMYMMDKEKERLDKELQRLEMRHAQIKARLLDIALFRERTHKAAVQTECAGGIAPDQAEEGKAAKDWKTVPLHY